MITNVTVPARLCHCEICTYEWVTLLAPPRLPATCQNRECRSRLWNGKKPRKEQEKKPQVILPKPSKIRGENNEEDF
jgi:hypothetical protein